MQPDAGPFTAMDEDLKRPLIDFVKSLENSIGMEPITGISLIDDALRKVEIKTKTVCTYCGVGCSFEVWTRDRHILKIQPVADAPVNGISTCVKGKFGWDFVNSPNRLTTPLIRENGQFRPASWEEALQRVADGLRAVARQHGGNAIGFIGSSKASNEEAYLTQKIARLIFGTNNVDNSSRYCQNPATEGLFRTVGYGGDAGTLRDLQQTDLIITVGSNRRKTTRFSLHISNRATNIADRSCWWSIRAVTKWPSAPIVICASAPAPTWCGRRRWRATCLTTVMLMKHSCASA